MAIDDRLEKIAERLERVAQAHDDRPLLTPTETAQRLAVSTRTLRDMAAAGKIRPIMVEGARRYEPAEVDRYLDGRRERGAA